MDSLPCCDEPVQRISHSRLGSRAYHSCNDKIFVVLVRPGGTLIIAPSGVRVVSQHIFSGARICQCDVLQRLDSPGAALTGENGKDQRVDRVGACRVGRSD